MYLHMYINPPALLQCAVCVTSGTWTGRWPEHGKPGDLVCLSLHPSIPVSCMLQVVSCILDPPSGIEECGLGTGVLPPTPSDPRILGVP